MDGYLKKQLDCMDQHDRQWPLLTTAFAPEFQGLTFAFPLVSTLNCSPGYLHVCLQSCFASAIKYPDTEMY